jgi:hypothetical protein
MSKKTSKSIPVIESNTYAKNREANTTPVKVGRVQRPQNPAKEKR